MCSLYPSQTAQLNYRKFLGKCRMLSWCFLWGVEEKQTPWPYTTYSIICAEQAEPVQRKIRFSQLALRIYTKRYQCVTDALLKPLFIMNGSVETIIRGQRKIPNDWHTWVVPLAERAWIVLGPITRFPIKHAFTLLGRSVARQLPLVEYTWLVRNSAAAVPRSDTEDSRVVHWPSFIHLG